MRIDAIGIEWADVQNHPEDFTLLLSASVTGIKGLGGLTFSGSIQGVRIRPSLLADGQFPIIGIDSIAVTVKGSMFGGTIDAGLVGGIMKLDSSYHEISVLDNTTPVFKRVFYLGIQGGFSMAGLAGFTIRLGLSELGPLQVFINVQVPGGLLLEPTSGLTINDFSAGVEFFKTLPGIEDPFALRNTAFSLPTNQTADTWLTSLKGQVALQAQTLAGNPSMSGFEAAFTAPMTITGSARIYSIYTSQAVFNGLVTIMISTDGKFMIKGQLNFANDNLSISGRLYADLSHVTDGKVVILFLADIPDQAQILTLYGKIKMGFRDASGQEVTFTVPDAVGAAAPTTPPSISLADPLGNGSVSVEALRALLTGAGCHCLDVIYRAAPGATVDWLTLRAKSDAIGVTFGGTGSTAGSTVTGHLTAHSEGGASGPTPVLSITTDTGPHLVTLTYGTWDPDGSAATAAITGVGYHVDGVDHVVLDRADTTIKPCAGIADEATCQATMLALAMRLTGADRLRYDFALVSGTTLPVGVARITFADQWVKNSDVGTTAGLKSAEQVLTVTVTGTTPVAVDPGAGGAIDVNVLNNRTWIDVVYHLPTAAGVSLDKASITDLAPEFVLSGSGLGSIVLDPARGPVDVCAAGVLDSTTGLGCGSGVAVYRYWLSGQWASTGTVSLTFLQDSWSYDVSLGLQATSLTTSAEGGTTLTLTITGSLPPGWRLDDAGRTALVSALDVDHDATNGIQLYAGNDWIVSLVNGTTIGYDPVAGTLTIQVAVVRGARTGTNPTIAASVSIAATTSAPTSATVSQGAEPTDATSSTSVLPVTVPSGSRSFIDVRFDDAGALSLISAGMVSISGSAVSAGTTITPMWLGGGRVRYLVNGSFVPGTLMLTFKLDLLNATDARGPPTGWTQNQSATVTGTTADLVRSGTAQDGTPTLTAIGGTVVARDQVNAQHYLEVRFSPSAGYALDPATINGGELVLTGPGGTVTLGSPVRVGSSSVWRYSFAGTLADGLYTLTFVAGSFADTQGTANLAETETFTVAGTTSGLYNPGGGSTTTTANLNGRGWVDVTFTGADPASILDDAGEFTLIATPTGGSGTAYTLTLVGAPVRIGTSDVYRFFFAGYESGTLSLAAIASSWTVNGVSQGTGGTIEGGLTEDSVKSRIWLDVVFTPAGTATVTGVDGNELATIPGLTALATNGVVRIGDTNVYRYLFTGSELTPGTLTVTVLAGSWSDSAGSVGAGSTSTVTLVQPAQSFFIEISGGLLLQLPGLDKPLVDLKAQVIFEINPAAKTFILTFDGQLAIYALGTVGSTSGRFVLDLGDSSTSTPGLWGVATLETNFSALEQYGVFLYAKGTLQINTTGVEKTETIVLKGIGDGGTDVTRTFHLAAGSFQLEVAGQARIRPPGTTTDLMLLQGGFVLAIKTKPIVQLTMYATASLSFGVGSAQLTYGSVTALFVLQGPDGSGLHAGVAGQITVGAGGGIGLPGNITGFQASGNVTVMFNTTLQDITFTLPDSFAPLVASGLPASLTIYGAAPGLDGGRNPSAPAGGEIYVKAIVQAHLVISNVIIADGFISITAAIDPAGTAYFKIDGAIGVSIPVLGAYAATLNLAVYVGTSTGVVGRMQLSRGSAIIPGVTLSGQFLVEINTFSSAQTIQTFLTETKQFTYTDSSGSHTTTVFGGLAHDARGNLVVGTTTINPGVAILFTGFFNIGDKVVIDAAASLTVSTDPNDPYLEVVLNGHLAMGPLGTLDVVNSGLRISAAGLVANLQVNLSSAFGAGAGLSFNAQVSLSLNTTSADQTLCVKAGGTCITAATTVPRGFRLHISGSVSIAFITGSGVLDVTVGPGGFELTFALHFGIGGLQFDVNGGAGLYADGIAMRLGVHAVADLGPIFVIDASGSIQVNTTGSTRIGIAAHSFRLDLSGTLSLLKVLNLDANFSVVYSAGAWHLHADASISFFGLGNLGGSVDLYSNGDFQVSLHGDLLLGSRAFGLGGAFSIGVSSLHYQKPSDPNTYYQLHIWASAEVSVYVAGLTFASVGVGFDVSLDTGTAGADGKVKIEASVTVKLKILFVTLTFHVNVTIGYLQLPPPTYLAGACAYGSTCSTTQLRFWDNNGAPATLYLNVGDQSRRTARNIGTLATDNAESFIIEQVDGTAGDATIKVTAFGRSNTYQHVSGIVGQFGDGADAVFVKDGVLVPVNLDGGSDDDVLVLDGATTCTDPIGSVTGCSQLFGGDGADLISAVGDVRMDGGTGDDILQHHGTGTARMSGGDGADNLLGSSATDYLDGGNGDDQLIGPGAAFYGGAGNDAITAVIDSAHPRAMVINGGTGTDKALLTYGAVADQISLGAAGGACGADGCSLTMGYGLRGGASTPQLVTGIEDLTIDAGAGGDLVTVDDLAGSGLGALTIDLGRTATINGYRQESIEGSSFTQTVPDVRYSPDRGADAIVLNGSAAGDTFTVTTSGDTTNVAVQTSVAYTVALLHGVRPEGDSLTVAGLGGDDTLDAHTESADNLALILASGAGDDRVIGSAYDDVIDSGTGDDRVTGGDGYDTFSDAGGNDTLIETFDRDFLLADNLLVIGQVASRTPGTGFTNGIAEDLKGIFENATLTAGDAANTFLVGDADGRVVVRGATRTVTGWHGTVTISALGGDDLVAVATRDSAGSHVYVDGGTGSDQLVVDGTDLREDVTVDDSSVSGYTERITSASWSPTKQSATTIDQKNVDTVLVRTFGGGDRVLVRRLPSATPHTVDAGSGDDQVLVGSSAAFSTDQRDVTNAGGTLNSIRSGLVVLGGAGTDTLSFDDTGDSTANTGVLTRSLLTGLGLSPAGATYTDLEWLDIDLGSGGDRLDVLSTHGEAGTPVRTKRTDITTGGGNDTVNIRTIDGPTSVDVGSGANTVNVGSLAPTTTGGSLAGIQAHLVLTALNGNDTLNVDDSGTSATDRIGAVKATRITGLGTTFGSSWYNPDGSLALPDLVQVVRVLNAQSGRFRLIVAGPLGTSLTTSDLDFDATAADVQDALEAIVGVGNVLVTKAGGTWVISYRGALAGAAGWARTIGMVTTWSDASPQLVAVSGKTLVTTATAMTDGWIDYTGFENLVLALGGGNDVLNVDSTPGPTTITTGAGNDVVMIETVAAATTVDAGAGDDILVLNPVVVAGEPSGLGGDLNLVGGFGSDYYLVGLWSQLTRKVTITDGFRLPTNPDNDTNILNVSGSLGADTFLFRRNLIALLNTKNSAGAFTAAEMVVYDGAINGGVIVNGLDGDDFFAFDDTSTFMTVNGDSGNDKFYVGQILTNYTSTSIYGIPVGSGFPGDALFDANFFASTRGWLTNGVSNPVTINGGTGDDLFDIFRNKSSLTLNGEDGDDTFIVRTFVADSELTKVSSGVGRDVIRYVMNAPVAIDGGDGYDTVIFVGTEFADTFVITSNGVYGGGRFISYVNVERLVVDGMEGNDRFYVQSTNPNVETRIVGGLGSDTVEIAGHAPAVQADDLLGHSGIVTASIESATGGWNGVPIDGITADIADAQAPMVVITPPAGGAKVTENGANAFVGVRLSKVPTGTVVVTVQAPGVNLASTSRVRGIEIRVGSGSWGTTATLTFTAANYAVAQLVEIRAIDDAASEDTRTVVLQTAITAAGTTASEYLTTQVANTVVTVVDDDSVGVVIGSTTGGGLDQGGVKVVEPYVVGANVVSSAGSRITYRISLNRAPLTNVSITVDPGNQLRVIGSATLTFGPGILFQDITLEAIHDGVVEGPHFGYVSQSLSSLGEIWSGTGLQLTGKKNEISIDLAGLPAGATATNALRGYLVRIFNGAGEGQYRRIYESYVSGGRLVIAAETNWDILPGTTAGWVISGYSGPASVSSLGGTVAAVTNGGRTIRLTGVTLPTANGGLVGAIVRITDGSGPGQYRRIAWNTADEITTVDPWGAGTITVGTQVAVLSVLGIDVDRVSVAIADSDTPGVVVTPSDGSTRLVEGTPGTGAGSVTDTYTVRLTRAPGQTIKVYLDPQVTPSGYFPSTTGAFVRTDRVQVTLGGVLTEAGTGRYYVLFNDSNWMTEQVITVTAIADGIVDGNDLQAFAPVARRAGTVQGPLFVFGGEDPDPAYNTSLDGYLPLVLPGETSTSPKPPVLPTIRVIEANQVDRLVVHNEDSPAADIGTLTSSRITGLGMAPDTYVAGRLFQGGITYSDLEALEILLGYGNDTFNVLSTHAGTTLIDGGAGNDTFNVLTLSGHTLLYGRGGDDVVRVGTNATTGAGSLDAIRALLSVDGGDGYDAVYLDDHSETDPNWASITPTSVTGLDMASGADSVWYLRPGTASVVTLVVAGVGFLRFTVGTPTADQLAAGMVQLTRGEPGRRDPGPDLPVRHDLHRTPGAARGHRAGLADHRLRQLRHERLRAERLGAAGRRRLPHRVPGRAARCCGPGAPGLRHRVRCRDDHRASRRRPVRHPRGARRHHRLRQRRGQRPRHGCGLAHRPAHGCWRRPDLRLVAGRRAADRPARLPVRRPVAHRRHPQHRRRHRSPDADDQRRGRPGRPHRADHP